MARRTGTLEYTVYKHGLLWWILIGWWWRFCLLVVIGVWSGIVNSSRIKKTVIDKRLSFHYKPARNKSTKWWLLIEWWWRPLVFLTIFCFCVLFGFILFMRKSKV